MSVVHRVTGYDKQSERLEREFSVPDPVVPRARETARALDGYRQAPGAFPLSVDAVERLVAIVELPAEIITRYDWFLEPFDA